MTKTKDENHNQAPNIFTNVCIIRIHIPQAHEIKNMNIINFIVYYSTYNSREMNLNSIVLTIFLYHLRFTACVCSPEIPHCHSLRPGGNFMVAFME